MIKVLSDQFWLFAAFCLLLNENMINIMCVRTRVIQNTEIMLKRRFFSTGFGEHLGSICVSSVPSLPRRLT